ncbi:MAG: hypothetical protein QOJ07_763 [Thermoleophilaceae bacterium]|jgi:hypothetical protein|nr:hypothetical protein [Thermoleophilaceae bacterium]
MKRFTVAAALICGLLFTAVAFGASDTATERATATRHAKKVFIKRILRPSGVGLTKKDVLGQCSRKGFYYQCTFHTRDRRCRGSLRIYDATGRPVAAKVAGACVNE